jgi:hypothetical protein
MEKEIVAAIIADLIDRSGFDAIWYNIDDGIKAEIISKWEAIVKRGLNMQSITCDME